MRNALLTLAATAASLASAAVVEHDWTIGWVQGVNPDGRFERRAIGVNGQWPPPVLNHNSTDTMRIKVTNGLNDGTGTSLHAHGMFFNRTAYWDGAVGVTQCPIPPGQSLTYEPLNSPNSPVDNVKQWGTYWTHGHFKGQYVDGFRTPSIIHRADAPEVHRYDDDYTVILADWYHDEHDYMVTELFLNERNPTGAEPVPKSPLVYFAHTAVNVDSSYLPGFNENATLPFQPGKTYRIRLINMSALAMFHFWIEGHDMRIIEADGTDTRELPVDNLAIAVAQRYSVLVTARNDSTPANWTIHANMDPDMFDQVPDDTILNATSTLAYPGATELRTDRPTLDSYENFDDMSLVPFEAEATAEPDVSHDLHVSFDTYADGQNYASFNNITWVTPQTPSLLTATTMGSLAENPAVYGPASNALLFRHMDMVEVTVFNWDAGNHPFHLHGTKFQMVWKSHDVTSPDPEVNPPFNSSAIVNPMRRDTVTIPGGGAVRLRFRSDNPGAWFFHCHIDWHLSSGLAMLFVQSPELIQSNLAIPSDIAQQCRTDGFNPSGNAGGLNSTTDFGTLRKAPHYLVTGWTPKAVGALTACIITALIGMGTVILYGTGGSDEDEEEEGDDETEARR